MSRPTPPSPTDHHPDRWSDRDPGSRSDYRFEGAGEPGADGGGRAAAAAAGRDRRRPRARRCSSPSWSTSATSPGSPGRPAWRWCCPTSCCSSPTAATATSRPSSWPRPASTPASRSPGPSSARSLRRRGRPASGIATLGLEADAVTWAQQRAFADSWFPGVELRADHRAGRGPPPGQGRRRGRPHRGGLPGRRRGPRRRAPPAARRAHRAGVRARARHRDPPARGHRQLVRDDRRLRARTGPSPTTARRPRRIAEGDLVVLDFGALVDGYCSDMTRTVMVGEPTPTQQRMLDVVTEAQQAGVDAVRAGAADAGRRRGLPRRSSTTPAGARPSCTPPATASASRSTRRRGWPRRPMLRSPPASSSPSSRVSTSPSTVGSAVEDTVVVTDDGCRPLTLTPKTTPV